MSDLSISSDYNELSSAISRDLDMFLNDDPAQSSPQLSTDQLKLYANTQMTRQSLDLQKQQGQQMMALLGVGSNFNEVA